MAEKMKPIRITKESELKKWFMKNYWGLGYSKIIRKDIGEFPDFIMLKDNKEVKVELETLSSNFLFHNHDINKVDEVVCIKKDVHIDVPIIELTQLEYHNRIKRISATIDGKTDELLDDLIKDGEYRNKSHVIEEAIKLLWGEEK